MILEFRLTMPNPPTWNGRWSGDETYYAILKTFRNDIPNRIFVAKRILKTGAYTYRWEDGWTAIVKVREVDRKEAYQLRKMTKGFAGYDWMVLSIIERNEIVN